MRQIAPDDAMASADAAHTAAPSVGPAYQRYALVVLLSIFSMNFLDRQIVNILAEPIKRDLGLADWQIGLMAGLAFALFYTVLGIPIARVADRGHRPALIAAAVALWSAFTMLCGFAQNFLQLVVARILVGVGEAGCTPPAHSLISDYVPRERRASALAFYTMGAPLGGLLGLAIGGIVADHYGWRAAFLVAGAPGLAIAAIAFLTLKEPRRRAPAPSAAQPSLAEGFRHLARKPTYWFMVLGSSAKGFIGYGHAPFTASFFLRIHGDEVASLAAGVGLKTMGFLGLTLGVITGLAGMASAMLGGHLADRFAKRDLRGYASVPAIASLITVPVMLLALSVDSVPLALCLVGLNALLGSLWFGPVYAVCQGVVPPHLRATSVAIQLFLGNLIGLGLGPLAVGALSDAFAGPLGFGPAQGVRYALMVSTLVGVGAFVAFWAARRTIRSDIES